MATRIYFAYSHGKGENLQSRIKSAEVKKLPISFSAAIKGCSQNAYLTRKSLFIKQGES